MSVGTGGLHGYRGGIGPVQIHYSAPTEVLAEVVGDGVTPASGSTRFRVETPDSRLRVKVGILFIRDQSGGLLTAPPSHLGATLYKGEEETDRSGYRGGKVIANDILRDAAGNLIHQSAPLAIPEDIGLEGWSQEFVTAADSLIGLFTTANGTGGAAGPSGRWIVQARWQPDGQRLDDVDWDYVVRNCQLVRISPPINLPLIIP